MRLGPLVFSILLLLSPAFGSVFSELAVTSCPTLQSCSEQLSAAIIASIPDKQFNITQVWPEGTFLYDNLGRSWKLQSSVSVEILRTRLEFTYPLNASGTFQNAYEMQQSFPGTCAGANVRCCSSNTLGRFLQRNSTIYTATKFGTPITGYTIKMTVKIDNFSASYEWTEQDQLIDLPTFSGNVSLFSIDPPYQFSQSQNLMRESIEEGFVVSDGSLGVTANKIGITESNFFSVTTCAVGYGQSVTVAGGSVYDQFSAFRASTMVSLIPGLNCEHIHGAVSNVTISCDSGGVMNFLFNFKTAQFVPSFGKPISTGSGFLPFLPSASNITFYIDIWNIGVSTGSFDISIGPCCIILGLNNVSCDVPITPSQPLNGIEILSNEIKRIEFITPISVDEQQGLCSYSVIQGSTNEITGDLNFDTRGDNSGPIVTPITCQNNFTLVNQSGTYFCLPPCTPDQILSSGGFCDPVNCTAKYSGERNWYNFTTGLCEQQVSCGPLEVFVLNVCYPIVSSTTGISTTTGASSDSVPLDCGNGAQIGTQPQCRCDPGWITNDTVEPIEWCSISVVTLASFTPIVKLGLGGILAIAFGLLVAIAVVIFVVVRLFARKKMRRLRQSLRETLISTPTPEGTSGPVDLGAEFNGYVKFDFPAQNPGELDATEGETLRVLRREGEWLYVQNRKGGQGFIPLNYVRVTAPPAPHGEVDPMDLPHHGALALDEDDNNNHQQNQGNPRGLFTLFADE